MPRARKLKDDEPSTLTPTVIETMHATAEVRGAKVIPRVEESTGDEPGKFTLAVIQMMTQRAR